MSHSENRIYYINIYRRTNINSATSEQKISILLKIIQPKVTPLQKVTKQVSRRNIWRRSSSVSFFSGVSRGKNLLFSMSYVGGLTALELAISPHNHQGDPRSANHLSRPWPCQLRQPV